MVLSNIIPSSIKYQNELLRNIEGLQNAGQSKKSFGAQTHILEAVSKHIQAIKENTDALVEARKKANKLEDLDQKAYDYCNKVKIYFDPIKYHSDKLEELVDDELWPLPKLRDMLFAR